MSHCYKEGNKQALAAEDAEVAEEKPKNAINGAREQNQIRSWPLFSTFAPLR
jgi:hypothetical protein